MKANVLASLLAAALSAGSAFAGEAPGQAYPVKPVRIVVGFTPGGGTDIIAREMAARMQESWGQSVLVENRPGAGGNIGTAFVAKSPPDGYTLLLCSDACAASAALYSKLPYDQIRDFAPITYIGSVTQIFVAHPSLPARTMKEVVALAKAKPGQVTYATAGVGTSSHLAVELFRLIAKIDIAHIAYKGVPPVVQGLLGGEVAMAMASLPSAGLPNLVNSGRVRGLALTGSKRAKAVPQVPTMIESGFPGYDAPIWYGLLAPVGTPPDVVDKLNKEVIRVFNLPAVRDRMAALDFEIALASPADFGTYLKKAVSQWTRVVKEAGVKVE